MKNYYEELEVSRNASNEVISKAYKVLAKKYHPDTTTEDKKLAEERFKKISEAYEVLSNEQRRAEYDRRLTPEIDSDRYNKVLQDNKIMAEQLSNLKSRINNTNSNQTYRRPQVNNTNNYQQPRNNYYQQSQPNQYYQQTNQYYQPQNNSQYYYSNPNHQSKKEPSFLDILRYKFNLLLKKVIALLLTFVIITTALRILYAIPSTRHFLINDLHLELLFLLFR